MNNLILFTNAFLSYLLVFVICIGVIIVAILVGRMLRKNKDAKEALAAQNNISAGTSSASDASAAVKD